MGAEMAMALADLIRGGELRRLKICAAPDCEAVLTDLSRNRSRIFCDTGNCGNRQHVAALTGSAGVRTSRLAGLESAQSTSPVAGLWLRTGRYGTAIGHSVTAQRTSISVAPHGARTGSAATLACSTTDRAHKRRPT